MGRKKKRSKKEEAAPDPDLWDTEQNEKQPEELSSLIEDLILSEPEQDAEKSPKDKLSAVQREAKALEEHEAATARKEREEAKRKEKEAREKNQKEDKPAAKEKEKTAVTTEKEIEKKKDTEEPPKERQEEKSQSESEKRISSSRRALEDLVAKQKRARERQREEREEEEEGDDEKKKGKERSDDEDAVLKGSSRKSGDENDNENENDNEDNDNDDDQDDDDDDDDDDDQDDDEDDLIKGKSKNKSDSNKKKKKKKNKKDKNNGNNNNKTATPLRLSDIRNLQLRRANLEKIFHEPYFDEVVKGKFCRVTIGTKDDGTTVYRLTEIIGVEEKATYRVNGKETRKYLVLQHGKAIKAFQIALVSNHSVTQAEMERWRGEMERCGLAVLTAEEALDRRHQTKQFHKSFVYTPDVVRSIVGAAKARSLKTVNLAVERTKLDVEREDAAMLGNYDKAMDIQHKIDNLDEFAAHKRRRYKSEREFGVIALNVKAIRTNTHKADEIFKARAQRVGETQAKADPFVRRTTMPGAIWVPGSATKEKERSDALAKERKEKEQQQELLEQQRKKREAWAKALGTNLEEDREIEDAIARDLDLLAAAQETSQLRNSTAMLQVGQVHVGPLGLSPCDRELNKLRELHLQACDPHGKPLISASDVVLADLNIDPTNAQAGGWVRRWRAGAGGGATSSWGARTRVRPPKLLSVAHYFHRRDNGDPDA